MKLLTQGNALHLPLADRSVQCVVTSPPYWGLRQYSGTFTWTGGDPACLHSPADTPMQRGIESYTLQGGKKTTGHQQEGYKSFCPRCGAVKIDNQLGSEPLHDCLGWAKGENCGECYVCHMRQVFSEVWRVLRDDGVCFLNLGDSYAQITGRKDAAEGRANEFTTRGIERGYAKGSNFANYGKRIGEARSTVGNGLKPKDLCGIPWRVALALQADGWWLRSDIIWAKPNPMPESVTDRPTKAHEYVFLLAKSQRYYWDRIAVMEEQVTPANDKSHHRFGKVGGKVDATPGKNHKESGEKWENNGTGRNLRTVWNIATAPYSGAHFATFPPALAEKCILAGSKRGDIVLDPFSGSGTTIQKAIELGRKGVGVELSMEYINLSRERTSELQIGLGL